MPSLPRSAQSSPSQFGSEGTESRKFRGATVLRSNLKKRASSSSGFASVASSPSFELVPLKASVWSRGCWIQQDLFIVRLRYSVKGIHWVTASFLHTIPFSWEHGGQRQTGFARSRELCRLFEPCHGPSLDTKVEVSALALALASASAFECRESGSHGMSWRRPWHPWPRTPPALALRQLAERAPA